MGLIPALIKAVFDEETDLAKSLTNAVSLKQVDNAGNNPLHYAVAHRNLELIRFFMTERSELINEKNCNGETAKDWFQVFLNSIYNLESIEELKIIEAMNYNAVKYIETLLKVKVSRALRFSQGDTLLHFAVDFQKIAIVKLLLAGVNHLDIEKLLQLKNGREETPLSLSERYCKESSDARSRAGAQEILNYLQDKERPEAGAGTALALPKQCYALAPFEPIGVEQKEIQELDRIFSNRSKISSFKKINPLRTTIVRLAYNICCQANPHCAAIADSRSNKQQASLVKSLLEPLFGRWTAEAQLSFWDKFISVSGYLHALVTQGLADQIIKFSIIKPGVRGWANAATNEIFLNPNMKDGVIPLVTTLIHEVTHRVYRSYDFFTADYSLSHEYFSIYLTESYQLAAAGKAGELTAEQRELFEIRQLMKDSCRDCWEQNLYEWMACNSAETMTVAILALATLPEGYARLKSKPKPALLIDRRFLRDGAVATHSKLPSSPQRPRGSSALSDGEPRPSTADSGISSYAGSSTDKECSPPPLSPLLTQAVVSTPPPTEASLVWTTAEARQASTPSSLACPANSPKPLECHPS